MLGFHLRMHGLLLFNNYCNNMGCKGLRNHVKLKICSFVINFNSGGVFSKVLYCVVETGYILGRSLGDCRLALLEGRKYQMVKTQTESHVRRPVV